MPKFLRFVRQARWAQPSWLPHAPNERQADTLRDLLTQSNRMSVYRADSQQMVHYAVAGFAANRERLAHVDYAIIDTDALRTNTIKAEPNPGRTPHVEANKIHCDFVDLTASQILAIAIAITPEQVQRVHQTTIRAMLAEALLQNLLDQPMLKAELYLSISANPPSR